MNIEKYMNDTLGLITKKQDIASAQSALSCNSKFSTHFTMGSDIPTKPEHFEFINAMLDRFSGVYYVLNSANENSFKQIKQKYRNRVILAEELPLAYSVKVDIFVPFEHDWRFDYLMQFERAYVSEPPFSKLTWREQVSHSFGLRHSDPVTRDYYKRSQQLFGNKELNNVRDVFYLAMSGVLPDEIIEQMYDSKLVGIEKALFGLELLIKYPEYRQRQDLICGETFKIIKLNNSQDIGKKIISQFVRALED